MRVESRQLSAQRNPLVATRQEFGQEYAKSLGVNEVPVAG